MAPSILAFLPRFAPAIRMIPEETALEGVVVEEAASEIHLWCLMAPESKETSKAERPAFTYIDPLRLKHHCICPCNISTASDVNGVQTQICLRRLCNSSMFLGCSTVITSG